MSLILQTDHTARKKGDLYKLDRIVIIDWIRDFIPSRTEEERQLLLENLEDEGQNTPVIITDFDGYKNVLVDGHGRYDSLEELDISTIWAIKRKFEDAEAIKDFMRRAQLGRRNISENVRIRLIGEIWNQTKQLGGQADPLTKKELAQEYSISESGVKRAAKFAHDVAEVVEVVNDAKALFNDPTTPRAIAKPLAEIVKTEPALAEEIVAKVKAESTDKAKNKVFKEAIAEKKAKNLVGGQADPLAKKPKSKKITLPSEVVEQITPIAEANNLSLEVQAINILLEHLAEERLVN